MKANSVGLFCKLFLLGFLHLLLIFFLPSTSRAVSDELFRPESRQLVSFKNALPDKAALNDWVSSANPCSFTGVTCKDLRISSIDLSNTILSSDFSLVSSHLLSLPSLENLVLKNSNLSGSLTSASKVECGVSLKHIDLAENAISGPVSEISSFAGCSSLRSLNLSRNSMGPPEMEQTSASSAIRLGVLDLSYNNLSGKNIFSWLLPADFSDLELLSLKGNKISGNVPEIGFKKLTYLDLSVNNFSSFFPSFQDCSNLEHLDLSSNKFYGDIGASLSSCVKISFLNLTNNKFEGSIPKLSNGSLQYLYLRGNGFQGGFEANLGEMCESLVELDLGMNNFSGFVPETIGSCSSLELLDISNNNFSGQLPVETILKLSSLKTLVFSFNNFVGEFPEPLSSMISLETLDLSSNNLSGLISNAICENPRNSLKVLYLQNNLFTGSIPESLSNCSQLVSLDLSFNYLSGRIPPRLGSLRKLKDLIIWLNKLQGEIPQELMYLQALENMILDFNDLRGSIPASISNCTNLNWISLSNNFLSGEIPTSLGRLSNLAILKLGNNSISGSIPVELGDCRSLLWIDLNTNLLSGSIPPSLSKQSGYIADSLLTGKRFGYIKNDGSEVCHGAGNLLEFGGIRQDRLERLSARHPCKFTRLYKGITQPNFNHNGSMVFLDLSYNKLEGSIPKELGSMYYLFVLNLGHNELSGAIPPELGGLKTLAILDMSHNHLSGSIPQSLTSLTFDEIDLSNNNLSGIIPQSAPFDTFSDYRFANNSGLCGYPLQGCGSGSGSRANHHRKSLREQASFLGTMAIGVLFSMFCVSGLIMVAVETRKRRRQKGEATALDTAYTGDHSHSATTNSGWRLTSFREALSINLSTFEKPLKKLTLADLIEATNGFHNDSLIGSGGFGDVYKAHLKEGSVVAIKKLIHVSGQGDREFTAEMETIGKIKHRNLVPLLGYCKVGEERLLVYEYMKYGSLEDVLRDRKKTGMTLNWAARRKIAVGAARGLAFLHHNCIPHIIHRDMKSSNVLIDENLEARVSDFGMARLMSAMDTHLSVSTLAGTPGYVPPEYYQSFRCSTKGDVYSFGVVLLELLTGKRPTHSADFGDNNLVGWVKLQNKMQIRDVFDQELFKDDYPSLENELVLYLKVASECLDDRPWKRPSMVQVMAKFKEIQAWSGVDSSPTTPSNDDNLSAVEGIEMSIRESIKEGNEQINQP